MSGSRRSGPLHTASLEKNPGVQCGGRAGKNNINKMDIDVGGNRSRVDKRQVGLIQRQRGSQEQGQQQEQERRQHQEQRRQRRRANATSTPDADSRRRERRERRLRRATKRRTRHKKETPQSDGVDIQSVSRSVGIKCTTSAISAALAASTALSGFPLSPPR